MTTIPTGGGARFPSKVERCPFGQGAFTQDVKVKLNRIINNAGQLANYQINGSDAVGLILLGSLHGYRQNTLGYR
jgi:hypothetical protein